MMGKSFDDIAKQYDNFYETSTGKIYDFLEKKTVDHFLTGKPRGKLLEIGCGTGHWSQFFTQLGYSVHAIDISHSMIEVARTKQISGAKFKVQNVKDISFTAPPIQKMPRNKKQRQLIEHMWKFDVLACMFVLEYLESPQQIIQNCLQYVKPTGIVIFSMFNNEFLSKSTKDPDPRTNGINRYNPQKIRELFQSFGQTSMQFVGFSSSSDIEQKSPQDILEHEYNSIEKKIQASNVVIGTIQLSG